MENKFKGTLGEWQINNDVSWPEITSNGRAVCIVAHAKDENSEVIMANQKLIAAAPDLLQAALDFIKKVDEGKARSTDSYNKFKAAINKALD